MYIYYFIDASGNPATQSVVGVTDASGNPVTGNIGFKQTYSQLILKIHLVKLQTLPLHEIKSLKNYVSLKYALKLFC